MVAYTGFGLKKITSKHDRLNKALHPRDDVDRREGGRGLASTEDSVDTSIQRLEEFTQKLGGKTDYSYQKQY